MTKQPLTRWFNLKDEPPVRAGWYDWRCDNLRGEGRIYLLPHGDADRCDKCEWRGIYREPKE